MHACICPSTVFHYAGVANPSSQTTVIVGVSVAIIILLMILAAITGLGIAITTKRTQRSASKEEPYYASIYDVMLTTNSSVGTTGVDVVRNQSYGTRAEPCIKAEAECIDGTNQDGERVRESAAAVPEKGERIIDDTDLDEDGYVDVNAQ
jgi:hypothetical protein